MESPRVCRVKALVITLQAPPLAVTPLETFIVLNSQAEGLLSNAIKPHELSNSYAAFLTSGDDSAT